MHGTLLDKFLREEATFFVRGRLLDALRDQKVPIKTVETDCFEITIDHERGVVTIEDILDATENKSFVMPLRDFASTVKEALRRDKN